MNEKINYNLEEINTYFKDILNLKIKDKNDFLKNRPKNLAASMCVFNILNSVIEIGETIISENSFETPFKYKEIFEILNKNKALSNTVAKNIGNYMYQRNMLAHQYGKIKLDKIYEIIENEEIIFEFVKEVKNFILKK